MANFEIRQKNLQGARKVYGHAIGMTPKKKLFKNYIELETQLGEVNNARTIYGKWIEWSPDVCDSWVSFAHYERDLGEIERARTLFELAVNQEVLDMPEFLWKTFIDFEIDQEEYDRVRALFRRLLDRTKHVKVWMSFAQFEISVDNIEGARKIYSEAFEALRIAEDKEERKLIQEVWQKFETEHGTAESAALVTKKRPRRLIKRRPVVAEDGTEAGFEEYYDYIFPGEQGASTGMERILANAKKWKKTDATAV